MATYGLRTRRNRSAAVERRIHWTYCQNVLIRIVRFQTAVAASLLVFFLICVSFWHGKRKQKVTKLPVPYVLSLLIVGDWGRDGEYNQSAVSTQMGKIGEELNIDFVISVGDNFYETGLHGVDDPKFTTSFTNVYTAPSLQTTWYAVLGNHDYKGDVGAQLDEALTYRDPRWFCRRQFQLKRFLCSPEDKGDKEEYK